MLVVVSGPAGYGKTTLARRLADTIGCPAVSRDEIREGLVGGAAPGDAAARRANAAFFATLRTLLEHGVTVVGDAAFQHHVWAPNLEPLQSIGELRIVQCHCDVDVARRRIAEHAATRTVHADRELLDRVSERDDYFTTFNRLALEVPTIAVDTTDGYRPSLAAIVPQLG